MTIFLTDNDCHLIMRALNNYLSTLDWQNEPVDDPNHVERFLTYFQHQYDIYARTEKGVADWLTEPIPDSEPNDVFFKCSNCSNVDGFKEPYCSQCGCKMTNADFIKAAVLNER